VDGVSLTVSAVSDGRDDAWFEVSLIPETLTATTLGALTVGDRVNIETDILARHVERMLALDRIAEPSADRIAEPSADRIAEPSADRIAEPSADRIAEPSAVRSER